MRACFLLGAGVLKECQTVTSVDRGSLGKNVAKYWAVGDTVAANLPFAVTKYIALLMTHPIFLMSSRSSFLCLLASIIRLAEVTPIPGTRNSSSYSAELMSTGITRDVVMPGAFWVEI